MTAAAALTAVTLSYDSHWSFCYQSGPTTTMLFFQEPRFPGFL